jgi:hypothetical protein
MSVQFYVSRDIKRCQKRLIFGHRIRRRMSTVTSPHGWDDISRSRARGTSMSTTTSKHLETKVFRCHTSGRSKYRATSIDGSNPSPHGSHDIHRWIECPVLCLARYQPMSRMTSLDVSRDIGDHCIRTKCSELGRSVQIYDPELVTIRLRFRVSIRRGGGIRRDGRRAHRDPRHQHRPQRSSSPAPATSAWPWATTEASTTTASTSSASSTPIRKK